MTHITLTGVNLARHGCANRGEPAVSFTQSLCAGIAIAAFVVGGAMMLGVVG